MNKLSIIIVLLGILSIQGKPSDPRGEDNYPEYEAELTTVAEKESKQTEYMMRILGIVKDMAFRKFTESNSETESKSEENYDEEVSKIMTILKDMVVEGVMGSSASRMSSLIYVTLVPVAIAINNYI